MDIAAGILRANILIVDDQDSNVALLRYMLEDAGYCKVSSTTDPREVVELHRTNRYDAILLDLNMPYLSGFEVMDELKIIEADGYIPVLVLTAQPNLKLQALQAGAKDFISKPFDQIEVLTRIQNMLEIRLLHKGLRRNNETLELQVEQKTSGLRIAEEKIEYLNNFDPHTGLPNRFLLREGSKLLKNKFSNSPNIIGYLLIDFARLSLIRESFGTKIEQELILQIANRLKEGNINVNQIARLGDSTFAVIAARQEPSELSVMARQILALLDQPFILEQQDIYLEACIGVSIFPHDAQEFDVLVQYAEVAMRRALVGKTTRYQFYEPELNCGANERFSLESALRHALEREELLLHYQPQVDLQSGRVVGLEALIRWQHPELGLISPARFIGLAEETGLIVPIGTWVLRTACIQAREWQRQGLGNLRIAVNLSALQFVQPDIVSLVAAVLEETELAPALLDLELTESLMMADVEQAICVLNELRRLGVQLSIDDFGTGYSSLSYLKRFPIDVLKIDQSFVREITSRSSDAAISDAITSMAHSLGMKVIAEGVETEEQCEFLSRNMCDEIQGFFFSPPLAALQIEALLREQRCLPEYLLRLHKPRRALLLVDDEPNILAALKRLVRRDDYQLFTAKSGNEGLDFLAQNNIDVIVSDQRMPGMTGVEFLRTVKTMYPDTVRIVLTGFTELQSVTDAVNEGAIYKFLTKPWDDDQLREHIAEAFRHREMADENRRLNLEVCAANQRLAKANRQLEELVKKKQQQIMSDEVSLDIVHEALQHVPQPMIGLDDDDLVVFVNVAAQAMFKGTKVVLGAEAVHLMPELLKQIHRVADGVKCTTDLGGVRFNVVARRMGHGTQSRGRLITFTKWEE